MDEDRVLRALGRVKKEAEEAPLLTEHRQTRYQFYGWVIGSVGGVIAAIITATSVVISYKNDVQQNKTDIATLRADVIVVKATSERVERDFNTAKPTLEKDHETVVDMATQREYGVTNKEWYQRKYGVTAPIYYPPPNPHPAPNPTPP